MTIHGRHTAVIGAGWAGCAAAIRAIDQGDQVTLFEVSQQVGGRARALEGAPGFDNGQHILIGAYTATLQLMQRVGIDPNAILVRAPLDLRDWLQRGFAMPAQSGMSPARAAAWGIWQSPWRFSSRLRTLWRMAQWQWRSFQCEPYQTVTDLCQGLPTEVMQGLINPLCISALNLPPSQASGAVFLKVLRDAVMSAPGSSDSLIPRVDLGALLPAPAIGYLRQRGAHIKLAHTVTAVQRNAVSNKWHINTQQSNLYPDAFERVVIATPAPVAARLVAGIAPEWAETAAALQHTAIATVYARIDGGLPRPMVATPSDNPDAAQFFFDRGTLIGDSQAGVVAGVVSHAVGSRESITDAVMRQLNAHLLATAPRAEWLQTVIEKRACFACTPNVKRPSPKISEGLLACGDYVQGPYPSTLEGAVRSAEVV
jgi:squalene-associated FAD-dependent desaturase